MCELELADMFFMYFILLRAREEKGKFVRGWRRRIGGFGERQRR